MAEVLYVTFGDYCRIAAEVLGTTPEQIARLPRIALADSAEESVEMPRISGRCFTAKPESGVFGLMS